jgi:ADP-ribosyltransferase exoenzyme
VADWVACLDWGFADSASDRRPDCWGRFPSLFTSIGPPAHNNLAVVSFVPRKKVEMNNQAYNLRQGNPCHDPTTGEFCETGGGAGGGDGSSGAANPSTGAADPSKPVDPGKSSKILTKEEQDSITHYQGEKGFEKINTSLRNGNPPGEHAKRLSSAIEKHRLTQDTIVYRGVGNTLSKQIADKWRDREPGDPPITFVDKGFVSTSQSKKVAESFSKNTITIKLPKGHNALPIVDRKMAHESEILLNRGSKFKVTNVRKTAAGNKRIDVEIMS